MATPKKKASATEALSEARVSYLVETTMGHVNLPAEAVEGKTEEELAAYLEGNDYLNRIGAHHIVKVTHETLFKRTLS